MKPGFNPMRWSCEKDGCFNKKRRPKIEVFADCFPRRINFGDVDGLVEYGGKFCLLEWKGDGGSIKTGQDISYRAFSKIPGNIVYVVDGNAETMEVKQMWQFWRGEKKGPVAANLDRVKEAMRAWVKFVDENKAA